MTFRRSRIALIVAAAAVPAAALFAAPVQDVSPSQARLKADVTYLASDEREGRGPGTKGLDAAADYIAASFKESGLKPAEGADGYFQNFELPGERGLGDNPTLVLKAGESSLKGEPKSTFMPLALGGPVDLKDIPVVFAGYGITAKDEDLKLDYDDYAGLDVKGKAVLIIRREPQQGQDDSRFGGKQNTSYAAFTHKLANAVKHGAKAIVMVNDDFTTKKDGKDELMEFSDAGGNANASIGFVMVTREFANGLMKAAGQPSLSELEALIDADLKPQSRVLENATLDATVAIEKKALKVKNVIGVLEGQGPHAEETIVVGGHYDHLGYGGFGSLKPGDKSIHNGADDNASGTATVLELARRLAARKDPLPRRVVFMGFSAEERGLIGSAYYTNHPLYPLKNTVAMLNLDMVGRLNDSRDLTVFGTGTSPGLDKLVEALATDQEIKAKQVVGTQGEFFASDHASFYMKDIPVVFFFTGTHPEYHRPADDTDLINFEGMKRIADVSELLLLDLAQRPERPKFVKLGRGPAMASASRGSGVYLGSRPSYADVPEGGGVKLDGVNDDSPAAKGGMKAGDVVVKFAGKDVKDIDGYMAAMSGHKPGETIEIVVRRDGKDVALKITLGTRARD